MAISQRLDMRQGTSLVMTPQLQQAIKLLQLSNVELAEFIEAEIERNPLLSRAEGGERDEYAPEEVAAPAKREELSLDDTSGMNEAREAMDASHEDLYESGTNSDSGKTADQMAGPSAKTDWSQAGSGGSFSGDDYDFEGSVSSEKSLHEHLHDQLTMSGLSLADQLIGARLIDETDDAGYCKVDLEEVASALGADPANVEAVLQVCQGFEPTGVMARDVQECLALQLKEQNRFDPAMAALIENLDLVAKHDINGLCEACGVDKEDVRDMISELRALTPRPGSAFSSGTTIAVVPDVFVRELPNGMFAVELNSDTLPKVLMDKAYYAEVSTLPMRANEKEFISECAQNASWLIKSLDQRARTILKVASEIVRQQDAFFAHGVAHLRPLNLKQVADAIQMHESTVSRVTSNKYMGTPRGLFELKYFFSAAIPGTAGGDAHSAEAVRYRIKQLVDDEGQNVLSDDQIVEILTEFGIEIARRTVAKYRESLNIPSSVQRRRRLKASA
ncbi:RNA polymerase factor sigma-54 [Henriciella mobilis]|uniref:RNA polymerase sigma-54 factor n=1 Tax=Henriciella mobilis TaxID=2305467 RepID=A0A399RR25_9PROT|nr:RNA polymerase factor sigma-54 [Henriciella mobilis]RIJ17120.1 RNA polymerase sigma-54 factor [Henriciella mobilis]RIJ22726.1 RNA polymerase sigma-54 factor [Henriciella mobilis]RIJ32357.1 RNA polymerase sigma-54 factor [Henriciella mobilis]